MNLERVEQLCLNYLRQATTSIVPVSTLLEHCHREPQCEDLTEQELLEFLRPHELVRIVDPPADAQELESEALRAAGFALGPRAILSTRVPTRDEFAGMMAEQLDTMTKALTEAIDEAEKGETPEMAIQMKEALIRAQVLREKLGELFS